MYSITTFYQSAKETALNHLEKVQVRLASLTLTSVQAAIYYLVSAETKITSFCNHRLIQVLKSDDANKLTNWTHCTNRQGETHLHRAVIQGDSPEEICKIIQKVNEVKALEIKSFEGLTVLDYACYPISKNKEIIQALLDRGVKEFQADSLNLGLEVLYQESNEDCEAVVRSLIEIALEKGYSIDVTGVLMYIGKNGLNKLLEFLLEKLPEISFSKKNKAGLTPLTMAMKSGQKEIARAFIQEMKKKRIDHST